jgi:pimeloyl-ACP methyl ester carboxylesterase
MAHDLPKAQFHVLEHSRHVVLYDEPEEVVKAIQIFLE